jgi:hypothetical protein
MRNPPGRKAVPPKKPAAFPNPAGGAPNFPSAWEVDSRANGLRHSQGRPFRTAIHYSGFLKEIKQTIVRFSLKANLERVKK